MTNFVLDCSVTICWCLETDQDAYAMSVLDSLKHAKAVVPYLWAYEVSNVLVTLLKRNIITPAACGHFINDLVNLPIETHTLSSAV